MESIDVNDYRPEDIQFGEPTDGKHHRLIMFRADDGQHQIRFGPIDPDDPADWDEVLSCASVLMDRAEQVYQWALDAKAARMDERSSINWPRVDAGSYR